MFETSVVKERVAVQRRFGVFGVSLAAHTIVVGGVILATISSVSFPREAPRELPAFIPFMPIEIPKPLGNPNAPRQPQQAAQQPPVQHAQQQTAPPAKTTPATIPDSIPVQTAITGDPTSTGTPSATTGERWGDPNGDPNGIDVGQTSSTPSVGVPNVVYQPGADVKPATVLHRVQPAYPAGAVHIRLPGWVIVRCVIGKMGEVRDVEVVKSSMSMFDQPAIDALRQWKFAPGYFHGQAVDTYFELKITYDVR